MLTNALLAWLHYLGFAVMLACLVLEHRLFKTELDSATLRALLRIDLIYGVFAGLQIATGFARIWLEKGPDYYLHNGAFHAKMTLIVLVGLLSIYPTVQFIKLRRSGEETGRLAVPANTAGRITRVVRMELLGLLLIPLFAALMARGIGHAGG